VNINKQTIKLYKELSGQIPQLVLYREVFGMTEGEAQATFNRLVEEQIMLDHRVLAIHVQKARNDARRKCGFREKNDEVKPMPTTSLMHLMGLGQTPQEPEQEEEEL
jgi:hypothetical protein